MFICSFCQKRFSKKEGKTLHERHCYSNSDRVPRTSGGSFKIGHSGKASTLEKEESRKSKLSQIAKERNLGGYVQGSGRGKKGWYKGFFCDSSWELAYVVYCLENNIDIKRNTEKRQYVWEGKIKNYIPDFTVQGTMTEIKGFKTEQWLAKLEANPDVKVLYEKDLEPVLEYVKNKYGKDFINLYE